MTPAVFEYLFGPEADDGFRTYRTCPECGHGHDDHLVGQLAIACTAGGPGNHCHCRRAIDHPVEMAAANGHKVERDPVGRQASVGDAPRGQRWACSCGANVVRYRDGVFGLALDLPCLMLTAAGPTGQEQPPRGRGET